MTGVSSAGCSCGRAGRRRFASWRAGVAGAGGGAGGSGSRSWKPDAGGRDRGKGTAAIVGAGAAASDGGSAGVGGADDGNGGGRAGSGIGASGASGGTGAGGDTGASVTLIGPVLPASIPGKPNWIESTTACTSSESNSPIVMRRLTAACGETRGV